MCLLNRIPSLPHRAPEADDDALCVARLCCHCRSAESHWRARPSPRLKSLIAISLQPEIAHRAQPGRCCEGSRCWGVVSPRHPSEGSSRGVCEGCSEYTRADGTHCSTVRESVVPCPRSGSFCFTFCWAHYPLWALLHRTNSSRQEETPRMCAPLEGLTSSEKHGAVATFLLAASVTPSGKPRVRVV